MVVKPFAKLTPDGNRLIQPGLKARGREYLRMIYGPDYTEPDQLARLWEQNVAHKRSMALRKYALGMESEQVDPKTLNGDCGRLTSMTLSLRPMTAEQLQDWLLWCVEDYAQDRMRSGESAELARANSAADNAKYFPDGEPAEGHLVNELVADGEVVGFLWIGPESTARDGAWWVWDIGVHSQHRGQGFGRAAMLLAEAEVKRRGGKELGLHVFGFNTVARTLYDSLGYMPTSITMAKTLS